MAFSSVSEFFAMGGHAVFVWLAYGMVVVTMTLYIVHLRSFKKRVERQIQRLAEREAQQAGVE